MILSLTDVRRTLPIEMHSANSDACIYSTAYVYTIKCYHLCFGKTLSSTTVPLYTVKSDEFGVEGPQRPAQSSETKLTEHLWDEHNPKSSRLEINTHSFGMEFRTNCDEKMSTYFWPYIEVQPC